MSGIHVIVNVIGTHVHTAHVASFSSHKRQTLQGILPWRKHRFLIAIGRELAHISRRMSFLMARLHTKRHENRFKCRIKPRKLFISNVLPSCRFVFLMPPQMTCNFRKIPTRPLVGVVRATYCRRQCRVGDDEWEKCFPFHMIFDYDFWNTSRHFIKMQ